MKWWASLRSAHPTSLGKPLARSRARFLRLDVTVARRRMGMQRGEQPPRGLRHFLDGEVERRGVRGRRLVEAGKLAYELQCGGADFVLRRRRLEIEQRLDVAAHRLIS